MKRFKRHKDYGFFDQDIRLSKLSQLDDHQGIDFEMFRQILEDNLTTEAKAPGGRPPYDYVLISRY